MSGRFTVENIVLKDTELGTSIIIIIIIIITPFSTTHTHTQIATTSPQSVLPIAAYQQGTRTLIEVNNTKILHFLWL